MKEKYDIGIVGTWYWGNYGSLLNGYATFAIIKSLGLSPLNIVTPYNGFEPHAKKFFEIAYDDSDISEALSFERVKEYNGICGQFLTGADQIWHYDPMKKDRRYDYFFKLDFVDDNIKKISFSTSFGKFIPEPPDVQAYSEMLLKRYSAISVRENEGVDILAKTYGIRGTQIFDPVFGITRDIWNELAYHSKYKENAPYLLAYILDPTPEKRKAIEYYANKLGIKAVNILDGFSGRYNKNKETLNLPNTLPNISAHDWIKLYQEAKFVITDSFHGVCFSIIYNKPFIAVQNIPRGIERFKSLLSALNMNERLVSDMEIPLDDKFLYHLDFAEANTIIDKERNRAVDWLKGAINSTDNGRLTLVKRHINLYLPEESCMGCGGCVSSCPVEAIKLVPDDYGVYRARVNCDKCIDCGKCKNVCAALNLPPNLNSSNPIPYAFVAKDRKELMNSASGGAGTVLAKNIMDNGGIVVGAAWKSDFSVEHIFIETKEELYKLQKSKYFQSYLGDTFKKIRDILGMGKLCMFVGTPCQVMGLKKYLGKNYSNLLLVDLLCANCPSAGLFKKYLSEKYNLNDIVSYNFRHKCEDDTLWNSNTSEIICKDGSIEVVRKEDSDDYLQVYHSCSLSLATQCLTCKYQGTVRAGDLTIGDCWGIQNYDKSIDASKGVSVILVNNAKGQDFISALPEEYVGVLKEEPLEMIKKYNMVAFAEKRNWPNTLRRRTFHKTVLNATYHEAKEMAIAIPKGKM